MQPTADGSGSSSSSSFAERSSDTKTISTLSNLATLKKLLEHCNDCINWFVSTISLSDCSSTGGLHEWIAAAIIELLATLCFVLGDSCKDVVMMKVILH